MYDYKTITSINISDIYTCNFACFTMCIQYNIAIRKNTFTRTNKLR